MKILVVEDNKILAENLKEGLELEQYTVDIAHDGKEALPMAAGDQCDLIILDIMMPRMNGLEFLEIFRSNNKRTPVLILSAKDQTDDRVAGLDLGADDYLPKPFSLPELYARVRSLLRRSTLTNVVLCIDNLTLNPKTKEVSRAGISITLSAKEYRLLEYFMRNEGQVLGEEDIITHGWQYDHDGHSNLVAVYVRYLRNKIDRAFPDEAPLIHTLRGMGYTMKT